MSATAKLLAARDEGKTIVCTVEPYAGQETEYAPRSKSDPKPWVVGDYRYFGKECKAVDAPRFTVESVPTSGHIVVDQVTGLTVGRAISRYAMTDLAERLNTGVTDVEPLVRAKQAQEAPAKPKGPRFTVRENKEGSFQVRDTHLSQGILSSTWDKGKAEMACRQANALDRQGLKPGDLVRVVMRIPGRTFREFKIVLSEEPRVVNLDGLVRIAGGGLVSTVFNPTIQKLES